jgi:hypothetical protein
LRAKLNTIQRQQQRAAEGHNLGTLLHIRGNVTTYNGVREVKSNYCGLYNQLAA